MASARRKQASSLGGDDPGSAAVGSVVRTRPPPTYGDSGGTIHVVKTKTTIYLPDDLKAAVKREALRLGVSEAEVIRRAVASGVGRSRPSPGLLDAEPFAARTEELLAGFGER